MDEPLLQGRIDGRVAFEQGVRAFMAAAVTCGCPTLWLVDADFARWPLGERDVVDAFAQWIGPRRRLVLMAASFEQLRKRHPRWVRWHAPWVHGIECRLVHEDDRPRVHALALAPGHHALQLADDLRCRGQFVSDAMGLQACAESVEALYARSEAGLPVTTLGL
ncbi:MAG: hypothetical protein ABI574_02010 [Burkholderiales bacterium]